MKISSWRGSWLLILVLAALASLVQSGRSVDKDAAKPKPKPADDVVAKAAAALYEGIRTEKLPNGLKIYLKPVPGSGVVTTMVAYKVGSADEELSQTGLSHYLEHLMFKGTEKIMPGQIDRMTLRKGGANNAYTSEDYTIYHFDFAAEHWQEPLKIEADRMRNLRIDEKHEFQKEKGAVIQELKRDEDEPWDLENKAILPLLFGKKTPYGHPVIGEEEHVKAATAEIIKAHYDKWYHPNNASLIVVGDIDSDKVLAKIKELFGSIPRKDLPARKKAEARKRKGPESKDIPSKFEVPRMLMGYNTVESGHPDSYALAVIEAVLSSGKTSRLYKKMIEGEEIASMASAINSTGRYPGWFAVEVELLQGKDRPHCEKVVLEELKKLREELIKPAELKRVKRTLVASAIYNREGVHNLADNLARGVTTNDLNYLKTVLQKLTAVSAEDVQRVARKYFDPKTCVIVWSVPGLKKDDEKPAGGGKAKTGASKRFRHNPAAGAPKPEPSGTGAIMKKAQREVLPNGLTLLLLENHRLPIVVVDAHVKDVRLREPADKSGLASMMGRLLDEGTDKHSGQEIAELIENVGGSLGFQASGGAVTTLSPDRHLGLSLLFDGLMNAKFPQDAFNREQKQVLSTIADNEKQPDVKASQLYNATVYGDHPFGRTSLGKKETVEKLKPEDCLKFHRSVFVPNNMVVSIVGDFDSKQVIAEIKELTKDWKKGTLSALKPPKVAPPAKFIEKIVSMPDAAQLHFFMGHPGIRRTNKDYYKLLVLDYVLGTGPGFTDRLSARLRDREGLAYTVTANISSSASEEPGLFTCYIGTDAENLPLVKKEFLEELNRIRDTKPTKQEVEDAKQYLLGSLPFRFTTNSKLGDQLLLVERFNLGKNYIEDYKKAVAAVTPEDIQEMAKKYIDPKKMVLVVAGAVDKEGKVLPKPEGLKEK